MCRRLAISRAEYSAQCAPSGILKRSPAVARVALVTGVGEGRRVLLVPLVRQALEEQQREDVLLVVAGVEKVAQQIGRAPQTRFQLLLARVLGGVAHDSQPHVTPQRSDAAARRRLANRRQAAEAETDGGMARRERPQADTRVAGMDAFIMCSSKSGLVLRVRRLLTGR